MNTEHLEPIRLTSHFVSSIHLEPLLLPSHVGILKVDMMLWHGTAKLFSLSGLVCQAQADATELKRPSTSLTTFKHLSPLWLKRDNTRVRQLRKF